MTAEQLRAWSAVLAARTAAIKAQKAYHDAAEKFYRVTVAASNAATVEATAVEGVQPV